MANKSGDKSEKNQINMVKPSDKTERERWKEKKLN